MAAVNPVKAKLALAFLLPAFAVVALILPRLQGRDERLLEGGLRIAAEKGCLVRDEVGGHLLLPAPTRRCALEIESRRRLAGLALDADGRAPATLEVDGAKVGERIFRPDGSIVFELSLPEVGPRRGEAGGEVYLHPLVVRFVSAETGPLTLTFAAREAE